MHEQFNLLKPTGYVIHQQFNLLKPTGYVMQQQFKTVWESPCADTRIFTSALDAGQWSASRFSRFHSDESPVPIG